MSGVEPEVKLEQSLEIGNSIGISNRLCQEPFSRILN